MMPFLLEKKVGTSLNVIGEARYRGRFNVSSDLQSKLSGWLSDTKKDGPDRWQTSLRKLLLKDQRVFVTRPLNNTLPIGQYINRAWLGFTNAVRQQGLLGKKCPESYFSEACAPGAQSEEFSPNGKRAPSTLCNLCPPSDGVSLTSSLIMSLSLTSSLMLSLNFGFIMSLILSSCFI
ncbi:unnamed protein product, partial [Nesidiocoris tenuis]